MPYLCELQAYWNTGKDPGELLTNFDEIQDLLYKNGIRKQYRNYPNIKFQNWEEAYYGKANYNRLKRIKKKYDPSDLFSHQQTVKIESN